MFGLLGLGVVGVAIVFWFRLVRDVAIPRNRAPFQIAFAVGAILGVIAVLGSEGFFSTVAGALAAIVGTAFLLLRLQSAQKPNVPSVEVGGPILPFSALDADGREFDLTSLRGKPYLLKFFRGHW
ncbi:MAG: hypothetical protein CL908_03635 [Deltaproteobacteria bacterium]|nr:hypothetical protein [Deltaproteobacteria bacterium]